jgi:hypothetical protein
VTVRCGAKHAIRGFNDSLRSELIHERSSVKLVMVQLPAVNTPQFDWARTHMSRTPRPVAPVVQPEVIADAVFRAACRPAREYWIGFSTLKVILARVAFAGQETSRSVEAGRADNLFEPVHDLHRTRGSFGAESARSALIARGPVARLAPYVATFVGCVGFGLLLAANGARNAKRGSWSGRSLRPLRLR